jgi:excisionase family DNA binding protein
MKNTNHSWMTVNEAAELGKVSAWTIYRACGLGELRHVRLGGRRAIRLTREALDEWMLQHERAPVGLAPGAGLPTKQLAGSLARAGVADAPDDAGPVGQEGACHA